MFNNRAIVTGRGGVGNVRAAPAKLDATSISHPQTASILAEHEAHTLEYEREVWKRHKEEKANKPSVCGRGGIGNITESNPRSLKPLRRASLFKGGGAVVSPLSSPTDRLDMNAYDERERMQYAHSRRSRATSVITLNRPNSLAHGSFLFPDSISEGSEESYISGSRSLSLPASPTAKVFANIWRKVSFTKLRTARDTHHPDGAAVRAERVRSTSYLQPPSQDDFLDFSMDSSDSLPQKF